MKRNLIAVFIPLLILIFSVDEADAQRRRPGNIRRGGGLKRSAIKRNNKQIANFRGRKSGFGGGRAYTYVGVSLNAFNYFGDLSPLPSRISTDIGFTRPAFGLLIGHRFGPRYSFRGHFRYGTLRGDDFESADPTDLESGVFRYLRNLSFRNRVAELSGTAMFDLFPNSGSYLNRVIFTPYVFVGASVFRHNPQALVPEDSGLPEAGTWVDLQPLGTEGQFSDLQPTDANFGIEPYSRIGIAIPVGLGVRYKINQNFDFSFEVGYRFTWTDYLDDVSANYVDSDVLGEGTLVEVLADRSKDPLSASGETRDQAVLTAFAGSVNGGFGVENPENFRGNRNDNDTWIVTSFKLTYILKGGFTRAKFR
ncbi:MAG: DUF6089 family protein [Bacteroidota bacterium]